MSAGASSSYFYKVGCLYALEKLGYPDITALKKLVEERGWKPAVYDTPTLDSSRRQLSYFLHRPHEEITDAEANEYLQKILAKRTQQGIKPGDPMRGVFKLGSSLYWPPEQTFQRHREVESPATNEDEQESDTPRGLPTRSNISGIWDDHDKRHMQKILPDYENFTGV